MDDYITIPEESPEKCDSTVIEGMTEHSYNEGSNSPHIKSPDNIKLGRRNNSERQPSRSKVFQGYFMTFHTLASLVGGVLTYLNTFENEIEINTLSILILLSSSMIILSLIFSLLLTGVMFLSLFCCNRTKARSTLGCWPILYPVILYIGYGTVAVLGIIVLTSNNFNLGGLVLGYTIYQIAAGIIFYGLALYRLIWEPGHGISPHLMEMERSTFKLNESEIKLVREEVKQQMTQIEPEKPRSISAAPVLTTLHFGSKKINKTTKRIKDEKASRKESLQSSTSDESYDDLEKNFGGFGFLDEDKPRIESVKVDPKTRSKSLMKPRLRLYKPKV